MSRFLVTGGAGFIGSHIVRELVRQKHSVRVLDNFSSGKAANLAPVAGNIQLARADIRSKSACLKACRGIDFVLHQAALRSVPRSMKNPEEYNEVNITGTLHILEAALENKVKSLVFASSSSVYGEAKVFPQREEFCASPISPYALSKLAGEHYCKIFSRHYGLNTASLRYFNVFGERQALDDEYAVVIPKFINCLLKDQRPPIFGTGKQSRDFTYVANVVQANLLAVKGKFKGEVFNVAGGGDYTILELVALLNKLAHKNIKPVFLPARAGDVFRTLADLSKSKKLLRFTPNVGFKAGLEAAFNYFKNNA